jgi:hypothetical protein
MKKQKKAAPRSAKPPRSHSPTTRPEFSGPHYHPATGQVLSEVEGGSPYVPKKSRKKTKSKRRVTIAPALRSTRDVFIDRVK